MHAGQDAKIPTGAGRHADAGHGGGVAMQVAGSRASPPVPGTRGSEAGRVRSAGAAWPSRALESRTRSTASGALCLALLRLAFFWIPSLHHELLFSSDKLVPLVCEFAPLACPRVWIFGS